MKIGIISDTHNDIEMVEKAVEIFKSRKVDMVIHAGDITSPKILELFRGIRTRFVLGNCDIDEDAINLKAEAFGFGYVDKSCNIEVDDKHILVFHGNNIPFFREAVASGKYDYIIKGHTHSFENYVSHKTRIINPGSVYREYERTISILDTETDRVEKIRVDV